MSSLKKDDSRTRTMDANEKRKKRISVEKKRKKSEKKEYYEMAGGSNKYGKGEVGVGMMYMVKSAKGKRMGSVKLDADFESHWEIKTESMLLEMLNDSGPVPHIPEIDTLTSHKRCWYLVTTLLGYSLHDLKAKFGKHNSGFSAGTWSRVGIQALYGVKYVHDKGYIHRAIKPKNLFIGPTSDRRRSRIVHILEFGLARQYAKFDKTEKKWEATRVRGTSGFNGCMRYQSLNTHRNKDQGRVDDLWSLLYMLIELNGDPMLPWQNCETREEVQEAKKECKPEVVMAHMPVCMHKVRATLEKVGTYQRPDYHQFFTALWKVMENAHETPSSKFDWETEEPKKERFISAWEDSSGKFFSTEPIKHLATPSCERSEVESDIETAS